MSERQVIGATEEEIQAIKGTHRFDVQATEQPEVKVVTARDQSLYGINDPTQQTAASGDAPIAAPAETAAASEKTQPSDNPAAAAPPAPVAAAKEPEALDYKFSKEYIQEAKAALGELKIKLGETKFAELEESIKKGLDSPFFIKNAKGGYTAKENIADIALKAQGFTGVPTEEEKAAKVAHVRENAHIPPSPVVTQTVTQGKTQKDLLKDLKHGDPQARKSAMYKLTGVDETMALIDGYMKRK
jgi:hypothetical protein